MVRLGHHQPCLDIIYPAWTSSTLVDLSWPRLITVVLFSMPNTQSISCSCLTFIDHGQFVGWLQLIGWHSAARMDCFVAVLYMYIRDGPINFWGEKRTLSLYPFPFKHHSSWIDNRQFFVCSFNPFAIFSKCPHGIRAIKHCTRKYFIVLCSCRIYPMMLMMATLHM